uniref:Uncharacterized protein n=1 Tax=Percolomonas cosmopolitus TaxID=63605 RepID=A0A7S1KMA1_9EUKA|mmetsp:Transcript_1417/g.4851  ORF Transcript_1417/g.4851 Transcript_1417/m.4851 type:complete len:266 (+) Transcript_1417:256-1053(+)
METHLHIVPGQPQEFSQVGIQAFSAGAWSSAVVLKDGSLYTWGYAKDGRLGVSSKEAKSNVIHNPRRISVKRGSDGEEVKFLDVEMGNNWCLARLDRNELWVTGNNVDSQLGLVTKGSYCSRFRMVPNIRVWGMAASKSEKYGHSAVIQAETGQLMMAGSNYKGKTGVGLDYKDIDHLRTFKVVDSVDFGGVQMISLGGIHSMVLDSSSRLWSFGCGSDGRLGHKEAEGYRYLYRELKPGLIQDLRAMVQDVAVSYYHGVALVRE